jgi:hypothetical protein
MINANSVSHNVVAVWMIKFVQVVTPLTNALISQLKTVPALLDILTLINHYAKVD